MQNSNATSEQGLKKIRYTENPWLQIIKNEHKILKAKKITWY